MIVISNSGYCDGRLVALMKTNIQAKSVLLFIFGVFTYILGMSIR